MPVQYAIFLGALQGPGAPGNFSALPNDGVVVRTSAMYPNGVHSIMTRAQFGDIAHFDQTSSSDVRNQVSAILQESMGILPRGGGGGDPPGGGLTAIITGASVVPPGATCSYYGGGSGGSPPYSLEWYVNGVLAGTTDPLSLSVPSGGVTIELKVYDSLGAMGTTNFVVSTDSQASPCADQ